jgi:hypothetical protein
MSLNIDEYEFIEKYGFSIHDFYYACIDNILRKSYWCCDVSELAYNIADKIHQEIDKNNVEYDGILYKLSEDIFFKTKVYTHNIAIPYKDIYFNFQINWTGNCLSVKDWDIKPQEEILKDEDYQDIGELENKEELEE